MESRRGFTPYHFSSKSGKGFTLIELLVVISIIGMLSSVVLVSLNSARAKARDAARSQNIAQLRTAFELAYSTQGSYPSSGNAWVCVSTTCPWGGGNYAHHAGVDAALTPYIRFSTDTQGTKTYPGYLYVNSGGPYAPYTTTGAYLHWSVERPLVSSSCAPGLVYSNSYPNEIFCMLKLE